MFGVELPFTVGTETPRYLRVDIVAASSGSATMKLTPLRDFGPRIQSRRSVSEVDFPAWWAAHWKAQNYGVVPDHAPDSIPGALEAARRRMGALTGVGG